MIFYLVLHLGGKFSNIDRNCMISIRNKEIDSVNYTFSKSKKSDLYMFKTGPLAVVVT